MSEELEKLVEKATQHGFLLGSVYIQCKRGDTKERTDLLKNEMRELGFKILPSSFRESEFDISGKPIQNNFAIEVRLHPNGIVFEPFYYKDEGAYVRNYFGWGLGALEALKMIFQKTSLNDWYKPNKKSENLT